MRDISISKYHGLGNDYLVLQAADCEKGTDFGRLAQRLCLAHYGLGADGLLLDYSQGDAHRLRIFNPDGSEAEKSGNGLRIFARFLFDRRCVVLAREFTVHTKGGVVRCEVLDGGAMVRVAMGRVRFAAGEANARLQSLLAGDRKFSCALVDVGNPHCVVWVEEPLAIEDVATYGAIIERLPQFVHRINVQFVQLLDRQHISLQIWERGAGITHASGSSSTAAAAVARSLGYCGNQICVSMPGGQLQVDFTSDHTASILGAVTKVFCGKVSQEALRWDVPVI